MANRTETLWCRVREILKKVLWWSMSFVFHGAVALIVWRIAVSVPGRAYQESRIRVTLEWETEEVPKEEADILERAPEVEDEEDPSLEEAVEFLLEN